MFNRKIIKSKIQTLFQALCGLNVLIVFPALAENDIQPDIEEDMSEMMELMDILEEETSIATKSKVNSDYVPGMVTVLNADDMLALGKRTVWDALSQVPGIKTLKNNIGSPLLVVRGVPFPFNSGNIKIMVNSITMSSEISGINSSILLMPIEQVERIEFIRGPSSAIYGNSAYMGLINIITHKNNKSINLNSRDGLITNGGGQYYWDDPERNIHFSANVDIQRDHDAIANLEADAEEDKESLIFTLDYKQTSLSAQWYERKYLINESRPQTAENNERAASLALSQKINVTDGLDSEIRLSYSDNDIDENKIYKGAVANVEVDFNWDFMQRHSLLFGLGFEHYKLDEATLCINSQVPFLGEPGFVPGLTPQPSANACPRNPINFGPEPPGNMHPPPPPPRFDPGHRLLTNESWNNYNLTIQEQYAINPELTLTAGVAVNRNSNLNETNVSPRLAFVWQMANQHLLKGQYAKGFRSPTYFELYDLQSHKMDLESEQVDSYELGYIYKNNDVLGRVTLFHSKLSHLIHPANSNNANITDEKNYRSNLEAKTTGIELEWEQKINQYLKWSFNISYTDSKDTRNTGENFDTPAGVSQWLGNLNIYVQPKENILLTAHYYQVGKQTSRAIDNSFIDGYKILDLTLNYSHFFHKRITLRTGIKNVFDDQVHYFDVQPTTTDSVLFPGRSWWATLSYKF